MKSLENTGATPKWLKKAVTDTAVICLCHSLLKSFGGTSRNFFSNPTKKTVCVFLNRPRIVWNGLSYTVLGKIVINKLFELTVI